MDFKKNYYSILGVPHTATKAEIKSAFRELAKKHHPDKNPDDPTADERFKEINLSYEVLMNDITRSVYDEFKRKEKELNQKNASVESDDLTQKNKRTYTKTTKVTKEQRVYIRGDILVKYWADPFNKASIFSSFEADYKIVPFDVHVTIIEADIHEVKGMPADFMKSYSAADLFAVPIAQPVKCTVKIGEGEEHYALELHDIRIREPKITNVTVDDSQSMATMVGEVYAYTIQSTEEEITEEVSECFGETGRTETKTDNNLAYTRKEYFHADCTTYWGPWEVMPPPTKPGPRKSPDPKGKGRGTLYDRRSVAAGCLDYWWIIPLLAFAAIFPQLALGLFGFFLGTWLLSLFVTLMSNFRGLLAMLAIGFFLYLLYAVATGSRTRNESSWTAPKKAYDTLVTEQRPVAPEQGRDSGDQLIQHHIRWKDYDSTVYQATLSILRSEVNEATSAHENLNFIPENSLAPVYHQLADLDDVKLARTYHAFDSIKTAAKLDEMAFANMIVSCVQSIPYFLVVDRSCNPREYQNPFITQFLNQCDHDCCVGYAKYGVRSPAEFIGDLRGDCDSRSLILYAILRHFDYDVALLTSLYYQHAMIAVHVPGGENNSGLSMPIRNKDYLMWETTQSGLKSGEISVAYQNLDYWSVDLLHEKNKP